MAQQLTHSDSTFRKKEYPIILVCENLSSPANLGSLLRLSDAFGIERILFSNENINFKSSRLNRTARGTQNFVPFEDSVNIFEYIQNLKKSDFNIFGLEITQTSMALHDIPIVKNKKTVLIIGNERNGISETILKLCDAIVHINMYGKNSSMNVAQASAIALYAITQKYAL